jgi:glycosyltransferase involved in cell wall biosynthesis
VVDGGSHDGTQTAALTAGARVITQTERGYGGALIAGFKAAVQTVVVTMDADLSHAPDFLADLWRHRNKAEVIIASRYTKGGTADISRFRLVMSRILNYVYSRRLALPIHDLSSGYRLYHIRPLNFAWSFIKTLKRLHSVRFLNKTWPEATIMR